jgi:hypothetical protein
VPDGDGAALDAFTEDSALLDDGTGLELGVMLEEDGNPQVPKVGLHPVPQ